MFKHCILNILLFLSFSLFHNVHAKTRTATEILDFEVAPGMPLEAIKKADCIQGYKAYVEVPVCKSGLCFKAKISLYWTNSGEFLYFQLPEGMELTKKDHKAFSPKDYAILHKVLANPFSNIASYREEDVLENKTEYLDAYTGSTSSVDFQYVPDAVMTTYTLWHLVHGDVSKYIKKQYRKQVKSVALVSNLDPKNYEVGCLWRSIKELKKRKQLKELFEYIPDLYTASDAFISDFMYVLGNSEKRYLAFKEDLFAMAQSSNKRLCIESLNLLIRDPSMRSNTDNLLVDFYKEMIR